MLFPSSLAPRDAVAPSPSQRDAQKRFCTLVMWRMLCLSYWEKILDVVPSSMHSLLPPEPVLTPIAEESTPEEELDPWQRRAKEVLELLQKKQPVKAVEDFASASQVAQELGSKEVLAGALIRGLVEAGAKSLTHTVVMLERYIKAVKPLVESMGLPGEMACVAGAPAPRAASTGTERLRLVGGRRQATVGALRVLPPGCLGNARG